MPRMLHCFLIKAFKSELMAACTFNKGPFKNDFYYFVLNQAECSSCEISFYFLCAD